MSSAAVAQACASASNDELFQLLVDNLPQSAVFLFDPDLRLLVATGQALRLGELGTEAVRGRSVSELVDAPAWAVLEPAYRRALAGEDVELEHAGQDESRMYRVRITPVRSSGAVIAGLAVTDDVTQPHQDGLAAKQARDRWRQLFHDAPTGMWLSVPGADGRLTDVNTALCDLLEMSREQILATPKNELLQTHDAASLNPQFDAVNSGQGATLERALVMKDGSTKHVTITATLFDDSGGPRGFAHFADVTAVKHADAQLREALLLQEAVLKVIPDPIHVAKVETGAHVWHTNNSDTLPTVHPDDESILQDSIHAVALADDGAVVNVRHRAMAADGSLRWLDRRKTPFRRDPSGKVELYVGITRDVTDQVATEAEFRDVLAFQEAVLTSSPDIVSVYDLDSMKTMWASRSLLEVLGTSLEVLREMQQDGVNSLIHPEDLASYQRATECSKLLDVGQVSVYEIRVLHADGTWRTFEQRSTPFRRDDAGSVVEVLNMSRDVTAQRDATAELDERRAFQEAVIRTTPDVISLVDSASGRVTWASRPVEELLGWSLQDLQALGDAPLEQFVHADCKDTFRDLEQAAREAETGQVVQAVYKTRHRDGTWRWISRRLTPFSRSSTGVVTQSLAVVRDVTSVVEAQQQLEYVALHDPLTSLPNRRLVLDRLQTALATTSRGGHVAVLYLDLDGFKPINDAYGHAAGDAVLVATANRLKEVIRPTDTVGRMGGDEFVVILERAGSIAVDALARSISDRLRERLAEPIAYDDVVHTVTCSVGVSFGTSTDDADDVLRKADNAMYLAKGAGKNCVSVFDLGIRHRSIATATAGR